MYKFVDTINMLYTDFIILSNMILFFVTTSNIDSMWISHISMFLYYFISPFVHAVFCVIPIGPDHRFEESHHELDVNFIYIGSK